MNKKGYTLVELLAVVAIMAIILLIAIPNVLEGLNESRMNNFGNEVNTLYSTAKSQFNLEKGRGIVKYTYNYLMFIRHGSCHFLHVHLETTIAYNKHNWFMWISY